MNNIAYLRYREDLSQRELAKKARIARSALSDLETGKKEITPYYRARLEKIFGEGAIKEGVE